MTLRNNKRYVKLKKQNDSQIVIIIYTELHLFSIISFKALAGRWITSPAAIRLTTTSSRRFIVPGGTAMSARDLGFVSL